MKKYLLSSYRLSRAKYWKYIAIISILFAAIFFCYDIVTGGHIRNIFFSLGVSALFTIIFAVPLNLARFHDVGKKNSELFWNYLLLFIIGAMWEIGGGNENFSIIILLVVLFYWIIPLSKKGASGTPKQE